MGRLVALAFILVPTVVLAAPEAPDDTGPAAPLDAPRSDAAHAPQMPTDPMYAPAPLPPPPPQPYVYPPPQPVYPQPVYPQPVYPQPVYPQPVYPQPAYPQPQPAYPQPAYPQRPYAYPSCAPQSCAPQPCCAPQPGCRCPQPSLGLKPGWNYVVGDDGAWYRVREVKKGNGGLISAGLILWLGGWASTWMGGIGHDGLEGLPALVPFAGAFVSAAFVHDGLSKGAYIFSGILQNTGFVLLIAGAASKRVVLQRERVSWGAAPMPGGFGTTVSVRF